jgi:hypothetical protein
MHIKIGQGNAPEPGNANGSPSICTKTDSQITGFADILGGVL